MIWYKKGDITKSDCDVICHQVNCQGKMGSGVAKAIRNKWPQVYDNYIAKCEETKKAMEELPGYWRLKPDWQNSLLGQIQIVALYDDYYATDKHQHVANLFAQLNYGYDGKRYTSYDAFWNCLHLLKSVTTEEQSIAFPKYIGCGLGGANWAVIETMIKEVLSDREVCIYYLEDKNG